MHELGVTQKILEIALDHAKKAGGGKIHRINLVIGALSGVMNESVQFYFDFVSKETLAEGARLDFKKIPVRLRCRACGREFDLQEEKWSCPFCQSPGPDIIAGREFYMDSIEIE